MNKPKVFYQPGVGKKIASLFVLFLMISVVGLINPANSQANKVRPQGQPAEALIQGTLTPTLTITPTAVSTPTLISSSISSPFNFQTTFVELGYDEGVLNSPISARQYLFRLPDNWLLENSYLDLEFSYFFTLIGQTQGKEFEPTSFGEFSVYLDDQFLQVYQIDQPTQEHVQLRIELSAEILNKTPGSQHQISIRFDNSSLCNVAYKAQLVIHPQSTLLLNYTLLPPVLNLVNYPRPFYQRSFEPDQVRFVLPVQPTEREMEGAVAIAARLGDWVGNEVAIDSISDSELLQIIAADQMGAEHLFVIGQPGHNKLINELANHLDLPISPHRREMALKTQGPVAIRPTAIFSYTITLTNTTSFSETALSLIDKLPYHSELVECSPSCTKHGSDEIQWQLAALGPGEVATLSLTLQNSGPISPVESIPPLENLVILTRDETELPVNISSLTTTVSVSLPITEQISSIVQDDYFFVTKEGQPVVDGDGILEEINSPWNSKQVILLITGTSEEAIYKASQALSTKTQMLKMEGPIALVREVQPTSPSTVNQAVDLTLADLGYSNQTVYGTDRELLYFFPVPLDWQLSQAANLHLLFSYSQLISEQGSGVTISLNNAPLVTIPLDPKTGDQQSLDIKLPNSLIQRGADTNKLSVRFLPQLEGNECGQLDQTKKVWLSVSQDSMLHLEHQSQDVNRLAMDALPFPFSQQADLHDILFVLPPKPKAVEQTSLLQLAAAFGKAAKGSSYSPVVTLAEEISPDKLSRYHLIVIGRPSRNPLMQQINSLLPQPFLPDRDEIEQPVGELILRLPAGISLGYVQEISSPWNKDRSILAVTGTTDEGVSWAAEVTSREMGRLQGNLALIRSGLEDLNVETIDTGKLTSSGVASAVATLIPEMTPIVTSTATFNAEIASDGITPTPSISTPNPPKDDMKNSLPSWVVLLAGVGIVVIVMILGLGVWQFRR